jgi:cephalosporin hydroxylase
MNYPNSGPALKVLSLPDDNPHMMAATRGSCGSSKLDMAVSDLAADDDFPEIRATRECACRVWICQDNDHLAGVLVELAEIGATWEELGDYRVVHANDGDFAVKDF